MEKYKPLVFLFAIFSALLSQCADSHSSIMATYLFEHKSEHGWYLTVSVPLTGLHQALLQGHKEEELWTKENQYNTPLAISYLQANSIIKANQDLTLGLEAVDVRLGNHQSNFKFKLKGAPSEIKSLDLYLPAMSENIGHINIARVKASGINKKVVLQLKNGYTGRLDL